jgi:hypothetical protein
MEWNKTISSLTGEIKGGKRKRTRSHRRRSTRRQKGGAEIQSAPITSFPGARPTSSEKDLIRPILVCWGTDVCRKIDSDYWIKKVEKQIKSSINNKIIVVITDVRYENESKWIKENGGFMIHLSRMGQKPSNFQERLNDPIVKRNADHIIKWKTFTDEKETCNYHLSKLFYTKGWSTYGDFK